MAGTKEFPLLNGSEHEGSPIPETQLHREIGAIHIAMQSLLVANPSFQEHVSHLPSKPDTWDDLPNMEAVLQIDWKHFNFSMRRGEQGEHIMLEEIAQMGKLGEKIHYGTGDEKDYLFVRDPRGEGYRNLDAVLPAQRFFRSFLR